MAGLPFKPWRTIKPWRTKVRDYTILRDYFASEKRGLEKCGVTCVLGSLREVKEPALPMILPWPLFTAVSRTPRWRLWLGGGGLLLLLFLVYSPALHGGWRPARLHRALVERPGQAAGHRVPRMLRLHRLLLGVAHLRLPWASARLITTSRSRSTSKAAWPTPWPATRSPSSPIRDQVRLYEKGQPMREANPTPALAVDGARIER